MKKLAIAALLTSVVSGAALADTADMIFQGSAPVVTPGSTLAITGNGGGALINGELTIEKDGKFTTKSGVAFEIRSVASEVVGDIVTIPVQLKYTTTEVVANGGVIAGAPVAVQLGSSSTALEQNVLADVQSNDTLNITSTTAIPAFTGGDVQATVAVMVSATP